MTNKKKIPPAERGMWWMKYHTVPISATGKVPSTAKAGCPVWQNTTCGNTVPKSMTGRTLSCSLAVQILCGMWKKSIRTLFQKHWSSITKNRQGQTDGLTIILNICPARTRTWQWRLFSSAGIRISGKMSLWKQIRKSKTKKISARYMTPYWSSCRKKCRISKLQMR